MSHVRSVLIIAIILIVGVFGTQHTSAAGKPAGLLPDLRNVVPHQIQLVNQQQHSILRFSNAVANTGDGPLQLRPDTPLATATGPVNVIQDILDANGNVASSSVVSKFVFEASGKEWEVQDVAQYSIHGGSPTGPTVAITTKMACCFIDWYILTTNALASKRIYWDCFSMQGLSVGWADQYHASTEGQDLDMTGLPAGRYYLVSVANPSNLYIEKNYSNNTAWVGFDFNYDATGNAKIVLVDHSPCESDGMCGLNAPNR